MRHCCLFIFSFWFTQATGPIIGIDLGTTTSCVAYQHPNKKVEVIENEYGDNITPSYVAFTDNDRIIGINAKEQIAENTKNTIFDVKRLMGRKINHPNMKQIMDYVTYNIVAGAKDRVKIEIKVNGKDMYYYPEEISAMILLKLKGAAERKLGIPVRDAVISVPAYFNNAQRQATMDAGEIAGLRVHRIINEPTAAALAYGLHTKNDGKRNILVFDLGGGTFDVSIVNIDENELLMVKSTAGNSNLGGRDFDKNLMTYLQDEFKASNPGVKLDASAMSLLLSESEKTKRILSTQNEHKLNIRALVEGINFGTTISRKTFEYLNNHLFESTKESIETALRDAGIDKKDIHNIILIGGSTRIPKVKDVLNEYFVGKVLDCSLNADEAVAYGAAVQAGIIQSSQTEAAANMLLVDVTPMSLGVQIKEDVMDVVIPKCTQLPHNSTKRYVTTQDNQDVIMVRVFEGEDVKVTNNNLLGQFELSNITKAPARTTRILVSFDIDANSILNVTACDAGKTDIKKEIRIESTEINLGPMRIRRIIKKEKKYRAEEEKKIEANKLHTELQDYCFDIVHTVKGDENLQKLYSATVEWLQSTNSNTTIDEYNKRLKALQDMHKQIAGN